MQTYIPKHSDVEENWYEH